jgi:hypothetical protein
MSALSPEQSRRILRVSRIHAATAGLALYHSHVVGCVLLCASTLMAGLYWRAPVSPSRVRDADTLCTVVGAVYHCAIAPYWVGASLMSGALVCYTLSWRSYAERDFTRSTDYWVALHLVVFAGTVAAHCATSQ